jgi:hypothetical protein
MTQPATVWEAARAVLRGLAAVLVLVLTAVDALVTAVIGIPPITLAWRQVRRAVGDVYRTGYYDAVEAEVIESGPDDPGGGQQEEGGK